MIMGQLTFTYVKHKPEIIHTKLFDTDHRSDNIKFLEKNKIIFFKTLEEAKHLQKALTRKKSWNELHKKSKLLLNKNTLNKKMIMCWPKCLFGFFHYILCKARMNVLANPIHAAGCENIFAKYVFHIFEATCWKRTWCWEKLKAREEEDEMGR